MSNLRRGQGATHSDDEDNGFARWDIPSTWQWLTVAGTGAIALGRQRSPKDHSGPQMRPYVRAANITWGGWSLDDIKEMNFDDEEFAHFRLRDGDVLINEGSGSAKEVGKPAVWRGQIKNCCFQNTLLRVRPTNTSSEYLYWYFLFCALTGRFVPSTQGVNIFHIGKLGLAKIPIPVPFPSEQKCIVWKIDSLSGKSNRARERLDHIPVLMKKYKQAILAVAFRGVLTQEWREKSEGKSPIEPASRLIARTEEPLQSRGGREATLNVKAGVAGISLNDPGTPPPTGWSWVSLRRIARQETGHTPRRTHPEYWDGGVPWIGIRDAGDHHGRIIDETLQTISEKGLENSSARLLPAGTVCFSRTASVGYATIMGRSMATSQDFATWSCTDALLPKYLMYALMAEGENIREFGEGSTHTTIYFPEIRAFHICLAPLVEQLEIVRRIEHAFNWIDRVAAEATSARKLVDHLDQAILAKAFRGELVPQDPNDEPARVLLEKTKAARFAESGRAKKKRRSA